jgi:hypothetical protein
MWVNLHWSSPTKLRIIATNMFSKAATKIWVHVHQPSATRHVIVLIPNRRSQQANQAPHHINDMFIKRRIRTARVSFLFLTKLLSLPTEPHSGSRTKGFSQYSSILMPLYTPRPHVSCWVGFGFAIDFVCELNYNAFMLWLYLCVMFYMCILFFWLIYLLYFSPNTFLAYLACAFWVQVALWTLRCAWCLLLVSIVSLSWCTMSSHCTGTFILVSLFLNKKYLLAVHWDWSW